MRVRAPAPFSHDKNQCHQPRRSRSLPGRAWHPSLGSDRAWIPLTHRQPAQIPPAEPGGSCCVARGSSRASPARASAQLLRLSRRPAAPRKSAPNGGETQMGLVGGKSATRRGFYAFYGGGGMKAGASGRVMVAAGEQRTRLVPQVRVLHSQPALLTQRCCFNEGKYCACARCAPVRDT